MTYVISEESSGGVAKEVPAPVTGNRSQARLVPFALPGVTCVVAGGLLAAAIATAPTEHGVWAVAYLVLVCGVAQVGLGVGQSLRTTHTSTPLLAAQVTGWNLGNAAMLVGVLAGVPAVADIGGALLAVTLILLASGLTAARRRKGVQRSLSVAYGVLIAILLISIPVGLSLLRLLG